MTPTAERILAASRARSGMVLDSLLAANPYVTAQLAFEDGLITREQAAGMIMRDRDFIAECDLQGLDKRATAHGIVEEWLPALVANMQRAKRGEG
jgi:hypothetical protein